MLLKKSENDVRKYAEVLWLNVFPKPERPKLFWNLSECVDEFP